MVPGCFSALSLEDITKVGFVLSRLGRRLLRRGPDIRRRRTVPRPLQRSVGGRRSLRHALLFSRAQRGAVLALFAVRAFPFLFLQILHQLSVRVARWLRCLVAGLIPQIL